jgi:hypothetical protein
MFRVTVRYLSTTEDAQAPYKPEVELISKYDLHRVWSNIGVGLIKIHDVVKITEYRDLSTQTGTLRLQRLDGAIIVPLNRAESLEVDVCEDDGR